MARSSDEKSRLIQLLSETPFTNHACKKVGISRATFYRWKKDNPDFRKSVDKALHDGRTNLIEVAEAMIAKKVKEGESWAIKFFLTHNSKTYAPKRPTYPIQTINPEQQEKMQMLYEWILRNKPLSKEMKDSMMKAFKSAGFIDGKGNPTKELVREAQRQTEADSSENSPPT